jgi:hypothetical protein
MNSKKLIIAFGDIHFKEEADFLKYQLDEIFIKYVLENKDDIFLIECTGDYFDKRLKSDSSGYILALQFFYELYQICMENKIYFRMIKGTQTHCNFQQNVFKMYENKYFKQFNSVCEEEIEDLKILHIPENYMDNFREYYKNEIFDKEDDYYDLIFFHGLIKSQSFINSVIESEKPYKSQPIWDEEDLIRICKGVIFGGHIHCRADYKYKIFYTGSFTRHGFGEEEDKGFISCYYDSKDYSSYNVEYINNHLAPKYISIDIEKESVNINNVENFILTLEENIKSLTTDEKIRILAHIDYIKDNFDCVNIITNYIKKYPNIVEFKRVFKKSYQVKKDNTEVYEEENILEEKDKFYDRKYEPMKIITDYINNKNNVNYTTEELEEVLNEK